MQNHQEDIYNAKKNFIRNNLETIENDEDHNWYVKITTDSDPRSAMEFEISITDYNEKLLWIEYDIFGKEGGIEAKYSNDKYYTLLNDENSYLGKIMDLVKGED